MINLLIALLTIKTLFMKHTLHSVLMITSLSAVLVSSAQVTKLSNNTNISEGIGLSTVGVMIDDNDSLWKTNGSPGGTSKLTDKVSIIGDWLALNDKIYFVGTDAANGVELWVTDGTDAGTQLIKDINPGSTNSDPTNLIVFNNVIFFFATAPTDGRELWRSDGTPGGTSMVKNINPAGDSYTDSTTFFINNNILFFTANDGTNGTELWKTNGTDAGTQMVSNINPTGSSWPTNFAALGTNIFFGADDGTNGKELWKSDGTTTTLVKDIAAGGASSFPFDFLVFNNKLFFGTSPSSIFPAPQQLWSTDGSTNGTTLVHDFSTLLGVETVSLAVIFGNKFLFDVLSVNGFEIWSSDGTAAGTVLFKDFNTGGDDNAALWPDFYGALFSGSSYYHNRLFNGKIFLTADNGTDGTELWISDGTSNNTTMVKNINPGSASSLDISLLGIYTQTGMYFPADDGTNGLELWKTDGTSNGTSIVKDINPSGDSFLDFVMFFNGHIYFAADDGDNANGDFDLYVIDESVTLPATLLNFTATLNGKAAQLQWTTSTEINTKNFIVERSIDGTNFHAIGSVNAAGNSTQKTSYKFDDASALNAGANKLYYRLQMVDRDGKFTYSKIATVQIVNGKLFVVYPNPVKDQLIITSSASLNNAQIRITDQSGKVVYQQQLTNIQAGTPNKINVSRLNKGVYYLQLITGNDVQTTKFMKY